LTRTDASLIRLQFRAWKIRKKLFEIGDPSLGEIAAEENIAPSYASRIKRLRVLAPDIVAAILAGQHPAHPTANKLMADARPPRRQRLPRHAVAIRSETPAPPKKLIRDFRVRKVEQSTKERLYRQDGKCNAANGRESGAGWASLKSFLYLIS
jgi:hypothetical protein